MLCWPVGDPEPDQIGELGVRARIAARIPAADDDPRRVVLATGDPSPAILQRGTMRPLSELQRVTQADVDAYKAAQADALRQAQLDAAQAAVTALPEADRLALRTRLGWEAPKPLEGRTP